MSEFKFACPVCGQHITAASTSSGSQLQCPTCFQKIIVPQAPASGESKFILSATQVGKPRPTSTAAGAEPGAQPIRASKASMFAAIGFVVLLGAAGATAYVLRDRIFKPAAKAPAPGETAAKAPKPIAPAKTYAVPTNIDWSLSLAEVDIPESKI